MRILIILMLLIGSCFALAPSGVTRYQAIVINSSQVAETNTHFLYQVKIPRSALVAAACTSSTNVVVYKSTTDTTKSPKWVVYTTDTLFLYSDQPVSTSSGGSLVVGYGLTVNTVNSTSTFTNCGVTNFWGFDDSTYNDLSTGFNLTPTNSTITSVSSIFGRNIYNTTNSGRCVAAGNIISGVTKFTLSFLANFSNNIADVQMLFDVQNSGAVVSRINTNGGSLFFYLGSQAAYFTIGTNITTGSWAHITMIYDGTQSTNTNRIRVYVNGVSMSLTFSGTIATAVPTTTADVFSGIGTPYTTNIIGRVDNVVLSKTVAGSETNNLTQYNMLFTPSTFSTFGSVIGVPVTPNTHTDTLELVCRALNVTSRQWYVGDSLISGATDSVFTLYADSAFYARKPTVKCMVSNGVDTFVGFEWTFIGNTTAISRWRSFRSTTKWEAYKCTFK